ncbi:MAG TPA: hypothetical protein VNY84_05015, partial [Acidimicrobiales bacterium]|nr:hypothetical protein [Acidimicrobiales bacterium]
APEPPIDPVNDGDGTLEAVSRYAAVGATHLIFRFRQRSRSELCDQMAALMALVPDAAVGAPGSGDAQ